MGVVVALGLLTYFDITKPGYPGTQPEPNSRLTRRIDQLDHYVEKLEDQLLATRLEVAELKGGFKALLNTK